MKPPRDLFHRMIGAILFLSLFSHPIAGQARPAVEKTPRQIAAMGIVQWTEYYCGQKQWSTASQAAAAEIFGRSLRRVNDERIATSPLSPEARSSLRSIRRLAATYSACKLEIAARDGGTMWIPMRAGVEAAVEELVADLIPLLRAKPVTPTPARQTKIRRLIATVEAGFQQADTIVREPVNAGQAVNLKKARASFEAVRKEYARASWPGSIVVLDWYATRAGEGRTDEPQSSPRTAVPQTATPRPGSLERRAILDALRPLVVKSVKMPVVFFLGNDSPKVRDGWAFVTAKTLDKNEQPLGEAYLLGETAALLRRQQGKWRVLVWGFSTDTSLLDEAMQKYPEGTRAIFGLPK